MENKIHVEFVYETIPESAQQIIEEIKFYSQYIDAEDYKWTFTSEREKDAPYINELNEYLSHHLLESTKAQKT